MKNRRGFTLTELLAVIVILGIVSLISIPIISNLSSSFQKRQYTNYLDSVVASAKLYNDSYSEDLFGHKEQGCAYVSYQQLVEKNLLNDIKVKDMSCNSEHTFVRIQKLKNKYYYTGYLACWDKTSGDNTKIAVKIPDDMIHNMEPEACTGVDPNNVSITVDETNISPTFNKKRKSTYITLKSGTGINTNIKMYIGWATEKKAEAVSSWKRLDIEVKGNQEQEIEAGRLVTAKSAQLLTPQGASGTYYLVVKVEQLSDLFGTSWQNPNPENGNHVYFGPFSVDNEEPTFETFTIASTETEYNAKKVKLTIKGKDTYTPNKDLKMCVKEGEACTSYEKYSESKTLTLGGNYDGTERTVYITFRDLAGNTKTTSAKYKVATSSKITYNANGGVACDPASKTVVYNVGTQKAWGDLCKPTRANYTFKEWNTKQDGTGTKVTKDTIASGNITVYAQWKKNQVIFRYKKQDGETLTATTYNTPNNWTYVWTTDENGYIKRKVNNGSYALLESKYEFDATAINLNNYNNSECLEIKKVGHKGVSGKEWKCVSGCKTNNMTITHNDTTLNLNTICDYSKKDCIVDLVVNWEPATYTIAYNANGGSGAPASHTYTYATTGTTNLSSTKPTKTGHTFLGWSLDKNATTASYAAGIAWKKSNVPSSGTTYTLYAVWKVATYTITYDPNGGSGGPTTQSWTYSPKSEGKTITLSTSTPTKTGHTFLGWSLDKNATTSSYAAGSAWGCHNSQDYKLYAVWKANTYKIAYNANGGSGAPASHTYTYATTGTTNLSSTIPKRLGYKFLGWSLSSTATSSSYAAGSAWKKSNIPSSGTTYTLYAVWRTSRVITKLNMNGGTWAGSTDTHLSASGGFITYNGSNTSFNQNYNATINLQDYNNPNYVNITKSGYRAVPGKEWCTGTSGNGTCYNQNTNYTNVGTDGTAATHFCDARYNDCTVTLYVNWEKNAPPCPTVTFTTAGKAYTPGTTTYDYIQAKVTITSDTTKWDWWSGYNGTADHQESTGNTSSKTVTLMSSGNRSMRVRVYNSSGGYREDCQWDNLIIK